MGAPLEGGEPWLRPMPWPLNEYFTQKAMKRNQQHYLGLLGAEGATLSSIAQGIGMDARVAAFLGTWPPDQATLLQRVLTWAVENGRGIAFSWKDASRVEVVTPDAFDGDVMPVLVYCPHP